MKTRRIGPFTVSSLGLGCMNLSHAYGTPPPRDAAVALLHSALDAGITLFDTAALYGFGANEELVGEVLAPHRKRIVLASKCGMQGINGQRVIDGRPETLRASCEASLKRLRTEVIDLLYLHRVDAEVPVEDSVGAMADLVRAGKIRAIGLSEVSAVTLRRAYEVHPIAALQTEYSLWTRNPEIAVLQSCRELGVAFVAFSPLARGFLGGRLTEVESLEAKDIRRVMPRFSAENFPANLSLLRGFKAVASCIGCAPATLALAWLLHQDEIVIPIPGTTKIEHLNELLQAPEWVLNAETLDELDRLINHRTVSGARYNVATQREIDTEEFQL